MQCNVVEKKEKIEEQCDVPWQEGYYDPTSGFTTFSSGKNSPGCTPSSVISAGSRTKKTFRIEDSEVQEAQASSGLLSGHKPACSLMLSFGTLTSKAEQVTWATELDVWAEEIQESDLRRAMTVLQRRVLDLESLNC